MNPETPVPVENLTDYERLLRLEEMLEAVQTRLVELKSEFESRLNEIYEMLQIDIASDRRRITALENRFEYYNTDSDVFERRKENVMAILLANGGKMLQKDLRDRLELDKAEVSRLVRSLEKEGLIRIKTSATNKKYKVIYIPDS